MDELKASLREICDIVQKEMERDGLGENWVHGPHHVERVYENFMLLLSCYEKSCPKLDSRMVERLKIAIIFHDVKRGNPGSYGDHAVAGADFFKAQNINGITAEDVKAIAFAIANHNKGLKHLDPEELERATPDEKTLLQLLTVMDGMDTLGDVGYLRVLQWYGQKEKAFSLLGDISSDVLYNVLAYEYHPREIATLNLKDAGQVLPHLLYDCYVFAEMIEPVKHLFPDEFLNEIDRRWTKLRENLIKMIEMKSKNEKCSQLFINSAKNP